VSLVSSIDQDLSGIIQSESLGLLSSIEQNLGGITESATITLWSNLTGIINGYVASINTAVIINPVINQDLSGLDNYLSVGLVSDINQGLGITISTTVSLLSSLNTAIIGFVETLSATITLAPSIDQDLAGIVNSAFISISPSLIATMSGYFANLSATISIAPTLDQDLTIIIAPIVSLGLSLSAIFNGQGFYSASLSATITLLISLNTCAAQGGCPGQQLYGDIAGDDIPIVILFIAFVVMVLVIFSRRNQQSLDSLYVGVEEDW